MINIEAELRKDLEEQLAKDIQEEIDFSIVADILKETGWTEVIIGPLTSNQQAVDIITWLDKNCKNKHYGRGTRWLFNEAKYATMFVLRWGDATSLANH